MEAYCFDIEHDEKGSFVAIEPNHPVARIIKSLITESLVVKLETGNLPIWDVNEINSVLVDKEINFNGNIKRLISFFHDLGILDHFDKRISEKPYMGYPGDPWMYQQMKHGNFYSISTFAVELKNKLKDINKSDEEDKELILYFK